MKHFFICLSLLVLSTSHLSAQSTKLNVGETVSISVFAKERWNNTKIKLIKDAVYEFTVDKDDKWKDDYVECDANGYPSNSGKLNSDIARGVMKLAEGTRRDRNQNWFCLIGEIFDRTTNLFDNVTADAQFKIGTGRTYTTRVGGTLVCFANDNILPPYYENNSGKIKLIIKRIK